MQTLLFVSATALLAIVAFLPPSSDAKVFTKCELASRLKAEIPQMGHEGKKKVNEILAKVICQVENTTAFNTSAVGPARPPKDSHEDTDESDSDEDHKLSGMSSKGFGSLLGIFQLPSKLVCNNTKSLCKLNCNKLIDDDITDDITCMKSFFQFKGKGPQFGEHCSGTNSSAYLSECNL
ncbi:lysozyme C, milk isozyme-like [Polyodon spathula]|uniref:lysozyme C, milk isozyme-like n=1 Tax=Polyodon spathula TaxID=7913 RepID=UPI001B7F22A1|nr:lysozyme C, milk isozyme-like [Polyodon spathula]